ncbi:ABC transporter substrate-binding protein [Tissierella sp. Yu-01]|uniref:ABC transporter substrate-binding protein n=1 Tax=Tissierella sp. Yu-01 TaxID=3035694 RepID=UPI00240E32FF|nr:ABC transporter substrate-binding protein [Tissierella sp. Yu-01]WFA09284.1 ABC transporter substrate-binding protein [Tissierella sp. Yu-01]
MKRNSIFKIVLFASVAMLLFVGCSTTPTTPNEPDVGEMKTVTITDVRGDVEIPENPERIVDLSGNSDILSILGYEVIGTANSDAYDYTRFPSYLQETLEGATILGYSMQDTMDIEAVMNLEPDLIIISTVQEKMYDQLSNIAPTVMIQLEALDWKEDVKAIGKVFNKLDVAEAWLEDYTAKAKVAGEEILESYGENTTYLSFLASGGQFYVFDGAGFGSVLYEDMELRKPEGMPEQSNISLPVVTYEGLASIKSDYIFVIATDEDLKVLEENTIWNNLPSVREGKVIKLGASPYFNQGYSSIGREVLLDEIVEMLNETK